MGKKYIIELEDKPFHKENGDFLYRVKGFKSLVFDTTGIGMLIPYTEPDTGAIREEAFKSGYETARKIIDVKSKTNAAYQKGLNDAWEAVKKLARMDTDTSESITGYYERREITDKEAAQCINIDRYTGQVLDQMVAKIGARKAQEYADRHKSRKRAEMEVFWKESEPSILTEGEE